jgi:branched-chain amino acid transport system ATP-binding protein
MSLLSLDRVTAFYGPVQALFGVTLEVAEGEVVALMGRNGMGKTTTIRTVCRMMPHAAGSLRFGGEDLARVPSHRAAQKGIGLVPEGRRCFPNLTVAENLIAAARAGPVGHGAGAGLFPRLAERRDQWASTLSGGEQQMLAIGRALMTNPACSSSTRRRRGWRRWCGRRSGRRSAR